MGPRSVSLLHFVMWAALAVVACDAPRPSSGPIQTHLGWRFADDRRCADTGAVTIEVAVTAAGAGADPAPRTYRCADGERGSLVLVDKLPSGAPLTVVARSPGGAVLYRGDVTLAVPAPDTAAVTLYFLGGP